MNPEKIPGPVVARDEEPGLWALIDEVCAAAGAPRMEVLSVVPSVEAGAYLQDRLSGDPDRMIVLGSGLVSLVTRGQLRAVLAHELYHLVSGDAAKLGWLGDMRELVDDVLDGELGGFVARLFRRPGQALLRASGRYSQAREKEADAFAVRLYGVTAHREALVKAVVGDEMFQRFTQSEVEPLLAAGVRPRRIVDGFSAYLEALEAQREEVMQDLFAQETDEIAFHPALVERLTEAAARAPDAPEAGAADDDDQPALTLWRDFEGVDERSCAAWMTALGAADHRVVEWAEAHRQIMSDAPARLREAVAPVQAAWADDGAAPAAVTDALLRALSASDPAKVAATVAGEPVEAAADAVLVMLVACLGHEAAENGARIEKGFGADMVVVRDGRRVSVVETARSLLDGVEPQATLAAFRAAVGAG